MRDGIRRSLTLLALVAAILLSMSAVPAVPAHGALSAVPAVPAHGALSAVPAVPAHGLLRNHAVRPLVARSLDDPGPAMTGPTPTATLQGGNPTSPPELAVTTTYTMPCSLSPVTLNIAFTNVTNGAAYLAYPGNAPTNTPGDTTLVFNLNLAPSLTFFNEQIIPGPGFTPSNLSMTANGGFTLQVGALAPGQTGQVTVQFNESGGIPPSGVIGMMGAYLWEPTTTQEVLSTVTNTNIQIPYCPVPTRVATNTPTETATNTPTQTATNTPTETATNTPTQVSGGSTLSRSPTNTATPVPPTATQTSAPPPVAQAPLQSAPAPPSMTPIPPSATPVPPTASPTASPRTVIIYKTVKRYQTVRRYQTVKRYQTVRRYQTVKRYQTIVRYKTLFKTQVRYKTVVRVNQVQAVHIVVNHKMVIRHVTRVIYRTVIRHRTVTSIVYGVRVQGHPKTGRFAMAAPKTAQAPHTAAPPPDAYISMARLGISYAPVWTRGYTQDGYGGFTYDIVPFFGVTRFSYSLPFGAPGLSMVYGHDDIYGSIFRYLGQMRRGDTIQVAVGHRRLTYVVRSVNTVSPTDVRLLNAVYARSTLALISCTPYMVDTGRIVVIAELKG